MTRYFDLSQPIQPGMTIYPGDPVPSFGPAEGVEPPWRVADLHIGTHTGTHIDSVSHYFPAGKNVDEYPISRFILAGIVLPFPGLAEDQAITDEQISDGLQHLPEGGALAHPNRLGPVLEYGHLLSPPLSFTGGGAAGDRQQSQPGGNRRPECRFVRTGNHPRPSPSPWRRRFSSLRILRIYPSFNPARCTSFPFSRFAWPGWMAPRSVR